MVSCDRSLADAQPNGIARGKQRFDAAGKKENADEKHPKKGCRDEHMHMTTEQRPWIKLIETIGAEPCNAKMG